MLFIQCYKIRIRRKILIFKKTKRFYLTGFNSSYRKIKSIKKNFENFKNKKPLDFSHERESSPEKNNLSKSTIKLLEDNQKEFNNNDSSSKLEDILPQKLVCIKKQQQKFTRKDTEQPVTNIYENEFDESSGKISKLILEENQLFSCEISENSLSFIFERKTKIGKKGKKIQFFRSINSMTLHEEDESGFHRESHNSLYPLHR